MNQKQKLLELIDQYAEARHIQGHSTYNIKTAAARREVEDELERALSGVGETVAWALKVGEELHSVSRFEPRATSIPQNAVVIPLTSNQLGVKAAAKMRESTSFPTGLFIGVLFMTCFAAWVRGQRKRRMRQQATAHREVRAGGSVSGKT